MLISGLQTTTLLDYPGNVAATIFTGGCNYRCPFCHNADLVLDAKSQYSEKEIMAFLQKRKGVLSGVCITGGEPTLQKDLLEFICKVKSIGYKVKLDTNGTNPDVIRTLYEGNLIDYIAMDIKASPDRYGQAVGLESIDISQIKASIDIIMSGKIEYEFRTTLVKGLHKIDEMKLIAELIKGAKAYYLQSYKDNDNIIGKANDGYSYSSFSRAELEYFLKEACRFSNAQLRGVD